jgi:hypothetical protein
MKGLAVGQARGQGAVLEGLDLVVHQGLASEQVARVEGRRPGDHVLAVHPGEVGERGVDRQMLVGAQLEVVMVERARRQVARELDEKLLGGEHRAPDRLLGPLQVARERVALDRGLARLQQPHDREHRQREHGHREIGHGPVPARQGRPGGGGGLHGGWPDERRGNSHGSGAGLLSSGDRARVIRSNPDRADPRTRCRCCAAAQQTAMGFPPIFAPATLPTVQG